MGVIYIVSRYTTFTEKLTFLTPILTCMCANQGARNGSFSVDLLHGWSLGRKEMNKLAGRPKIDQQQSDAQNSTSALKM